tara:strand:- start:17 stop:298 length:282 start_codon:yes stop_codon:yes gene_type:complete
MSETIAAYVIPPLRSALELTVGPKHIVQPVENERSVRLPIIISSGSSIAPCGWVRKRREEERKRRKMSENKFAPRRRSAAACPFPNNDVTHRL